METSTGQDCLERVLAEHRPADNYCRLTGAYNHRNPSTIRMMDSRILGQISLATTTVARCGLSPAMLYRHPTNDVDKIGNFSLNKQTSKAANKHTACTHRVYKARPIQVLERAEPTMSNKYLAIRKTAPKSESLDLEFDTEADYSESSSENDILTDEDDEGGGGYDNISSRILSSVRNLASSGRESSGQHVNSEGEDTEGESDGTETETETEAEPAAVAGPPSLAVEQAAELLGKLELADIKELLNKTIESKSGTTAGTTAGTNRKAQNSVELLQNNLDVLAGSKTDGFRFLCLCVSCAFGGRKGSLRYNIAFPQIGLYQVLDKIDFGSGKGDELNVSKCCYIGHILLYFWNHSEDLKVRKKFRCLVNEKYGNLGQVIKSKGNIVKEIGSVNLWGKITRPVPSEAKARILRNKKSEFVLDPASFKQVLSVLEINPDE